MNIELLSTSEWPLLPVPMQSSDPGEAWMWGDFVATLQKDPLTMCQQVQVVLGEPITKSPMAYPYAMTVFHDKTKNPHELLSRPVLCVALEQPDYDAISEIPGGKDAFIGEPRGKGPVMVGVFSGRRHMNLGPYRGPVTVEAARNHFFSVIRSQLRLSENPVCIGTINDILGNPQTGSPAPPGTAPASKREARLLLFLILVVLLFLAWRLLFSATSDL